MGKPPSHPNKVIEISPSKTYPEKPKKKINISSFAQLNLKSFGGSFKNLRVMKSVNLEDKCLFNGEVSLNIVLMWLTVHFRYQIKLLIVSPIWRLIINFLEGSLPTEEA
jgi:hypothetical protein